MHLPPQHYLYSSFPSKLAHSYKTIRKVLVSFICYIRISSEDYLRHIAFYSLTAQNCEKNSTPYILFSINLFNLLAAFRQSMPRLFINIIRRFDSINRLTAYSIKIPSKLGNILQHMLLTMKMTIISAIDCGGTTGSDIYQ